MAPTVSGDITPHTGLSISPLELSSSAQRRDALRLFCLLLPPANRDTLQALVQFLSRVALHSDGIILIDGTEVCACGLGHVINYKPL